jgi:hypothetical protein
MDILRLFINCTASQRTHAAGNTYIHERTFRGEADSRLQQTHWRWQHTGYSLLNTGRTSGLQSKISCPTLDLYEAEESSVDTWQRVNGVRD